jgi:flagellar export protein FliJ
MADPLGTLLRLRRLGVDQARRGLADCLGAEDAAAAAVRQMEADVARETEHATTLSGGDAVVEDFALWLRRIRIQQAAALTALATAEAHTNEARAVLAAGRAAVRAVELLLERRATERAASEARTIQLTLDEIAHSSRSD